MSRPPHWFDTPAGQCLLQWQAAQFDAAVANLFGYHALQLGLPRLNALSANRMPHKWLALAAHESGRAAHAPAALCADNIALPFADGSLDLLCMPLALESSAQPLASLREARRVLRPEGKLLIGGINAASLWRLRRACGMPARDDAELPLRQAITPWQLHGWLRLLDLDIDSVRHGCWQPAVRTQRGMARWAWLDRMGARLWPALGAAHFTVATKRVHGATLISPAWHTAPAAVVPPLQPAAPPAQGCTAAAPAPAPMPAPAAAAQTATPARAQQGRA